MKFSDIPSRQKIDRLYKRVESGDKAAERELKDMSRTLARRANDRLKALNKAQLNPPSKKRFEYYLQSQLGRETVPLNPDRDTLEALTTYLRFKTSTVRGIKKEYYGQMKWVEKEFGIKIKDKSAYLEFLDTDLARELWKVDSREIAFEAAQAVNKGASIDDLKSLLVDYLSGDKDLFEVWDEWTKVD